MRDETNNGWHPLFRSRTRSKGPFIADQSLRWLDAPLERQFDCLDPERFRAIRRENEKSVFSKAECLPDECKWVVVEGANARSHFLADLSRDRLCLMIEAGMGKTTAMQQICYLRPRLDPSHLVLGCPFAMLPDDELDYLDNGERSFLPKLIHTTSQSTLANRPAQLLERKTRSHRLTLVVDALDQTSAIDSAQQKAMALRRFLNRYPETKCVVSGRPNSVMDFRDSLFGADNWCFAQLMDFNTKQAATYVGEKRLSCLSLLDATLSPQPRMLEAIRELTIDELSKLRTAAELHSVAVRKTLTMAMPSGDTDMSLDDATYLLSLLAIGLHMKDNFDGIRTDNFTTFVKQLHKNHQDAHEQHSNHTDAVGLERKIKKLCKLNEILDFAFLDGTWQTQVFFRSRTLQDFFAAYWLTKYSCNAREQAWLNEHRQQQQARHTFHPKQDADLYQFWLFLTEMPLGSAVNEKKLMPWLVAINTLFTAKPGNAESPTRSTEMLYRSMWNLLRLAGEFPVVKPTQEHSYPMQTVFWNSIVRLQCEVRSAVENANLKHRTVVAPEGDSKTVAKEILQNFLCEVFSKRCPHFRKFDQHGFVTIQASKYWFGDGNDEHNIRRIESAYRIAKHPISHNIVSRFDPCLGKHYDHHGSCDNLNWFDAACIAIWTHCQLPTEQQWECAFRGNQRPPAANPPWHVAIQFNRTLRVFSLDELIARVVSDPEWAPIRTDLTSNSLSEFERCELLVSVDKVFKAGFATKSQTAEGHTTKSDSMLERVANWVQEKKRNRQRLDTLFARIPNEFGLYDMQSRNWEWCSNWYREQPHETPEYVSKNRTARGGLTSIDILDASQGTIVFRTGKSPADRASARFVRPQC